MELSILVAKMSAVTFLAIAIGSLIGRLNIPNMIDEFEKNSALTFMSGWFIFILGALLVNYHNTWTQDWTVLVTILGWLCVLKGLVLITIPIRQFMSIGKTIYSNPTRTGVIFLILAGVFGYFGFMA